MEAKMPVIPEKIKCAAIRDSWSGRVFTGPYHGAIFKQQPRGILRDGRQGFVTTTGRFVDRIEVLKVAEAANQIIKKHHPKDRLMSEDYGCTEN